LILKLYNVIAKYLEHEEVFAEVAKGRGIKPTPQLLGLIYATVEKYPKLQSDKSVKILLEEIKKAESSVLFERKILNKRISAFNKFVMTWPNNLVLRMIDIKPLDYDNIIPKEE
jgi:hypothetical protein